MDDNTKPKELDNILPNGTGATYLAIFDPQNKPIYDIHKNLPIGLFVTNFSFEEDEEEDDCGEIVIETDNVEIINTPQLNYLMPIRLQWGWIYPNGQSKSSPVKSVVVKKHKIDFTNEGVKFTIEVASSTFLLKTQPARYGSGNQGRDFIK